MEQQLTEILVEVIQQTDSAILVSDSEVEAWLPLSQVEVIEERSEEVWLIELPVWLAKRKELV